MSTASHPAYLTLSADKLASLQPELYLAKAPLRHLGWRAFALVSPYIFSPRELRIQLRTMLKDGDARAATVVSIAPLCVAAYSDEFDAVVLLQFPERLTVDYRLEVGMRLLAVNNYVSDFSPHRDITPGPRCTDQFTGFHPLIADFLTEDAARLEALKQRIPEEEWRRAHELGLEKWQNRPRCRNGSPLLAKYPAGSILGGMVIVTIAILIVIGIIVGWLVFFD